ncbi:MAG: methylmalonyl Co-A mutase-associated GTPase MeaB [Thermoanaerobaculia bacterium]
MQEDSGTSRRPELTVDGYVEGVRQGDRSVLARAITLIESRRSDRQSMALETLARLLPATEGASRGGITGVPGVGKSTLIDALGMRLIEQNHRVAVLAVDPSSSLSGGSILGDKSRMPRLAAEPRAFIRPSPSAASLGGVARRTREAMLLCEAAGYDVVLVETIGVGQSETVVADMVDFFLVLMLSGAGDQLQGIKKGILELADGVAVTKADDSADRVKTALSEYRAAMRYQRPRSPSWRPRVLAVSARTGQGLDELWALVEEHREALSATGELEEMRREQRRRALWRQIDERLLEAFRSHRSVRQRLEEAEKAVLDGSRTPSQAASELIGAFRAEPSRD